MPVAFADVLEPLGMQKNPAEGGSSLSQNHPPTPCDTSRGSRTSGSARGERAKELYLNPSWAYPTGQGITNMPAARAFRIASLITPNCSARASPASQPIDMEMVNTLTACQRLEVKTPHLGRVSPRPCVAVASMEGVLVNQHLGEAEKLLVYGHKDGRVHLVAARTTPAKGGGMQRWRDLAEILADCSTLLVGGVGTNPKKVLAAAGIEVLEIEGLIDEAVQAVFAGEPLNHMVKRTVTACGASCSGTGMGCG